MTERIKFTHFEDEIEAKNSEFLQLIISLLDPHTPKILGGLIKVFSFEDKLKLSEFGKKPDGGEQESIYNLYYELIRKYSPNWEAILIEDICNEIFQKWPTNASDFNRSYNLLISKNFLRSDSGDIDKNKIDELIKVKVNSFCLGLNLMARIKKMNYDQILGFNLTEYITNAKLIIAKQEIDSLLSDFSFRYNHDKSKLTKAILIALLRSSQKYHKDLFKDRTPTKRYISTKNITNFIKDFYGFDLKTTTFERKCKEFNIDLKSFKKLNS